MKSLLNAFNAGEVSPAMEGRVDLPNITRACRQLRNFLPAVTGGAYRRPPLLHVAVAKDPAQHVRLIPFNFSADVKFIIEAGHNYLRFWDGATGTAGGEPIESPWAATDLDQLQFVQSNDVMFFSREGFHPYELLRKPDSVWELREIPWKYPPLRDENVEATTVQLLGDAGTPGAPGSGAPGAAAVDLWTPATNTIKLFSTAESYMTANAVVSTTAASAPPVGLGTAHNATIQRMRAYWLPSQSGSYEFRLTGVRTFGRMWLNSTAGAGQTGAKVILQQNYTDAAATKASGKIPAIVAGSVYWAEFLIVATNKPSQGKFQYRRDGGAWTDFIATDLAPPATPGTEETTGLDLVASDDLFRPGHVGAFWQIGHYRDTLSTEISFAPGGGTGQAGASEGIRIKGRWEFFTYGRWEGSVFVEQQNKAGGWDIIRRFTGKMDTNKTAAGIVENEEVMRVRASGITAEPAGGTEEDPEIAQPRFVLEAVESRVYGLVRITEFVHARLVKCDIISAVWARTPTALWAEGAWSGVRGFPRAVTLHRQRLIFAGTPLEPQSMWGSVSGDFRNFERTILEDGSFYYQIASQESNPIFWLASQDGLIIGTQGDEWIMEGDVSGSAPATVKRQSRYGSEQVAPILAGSVVLFIQRGGFSLREYVFVFDQQNYTAPHLSQLVEHMTRGGIRYIAYAQNPDQVVWVVTRDGRLLSCTYRREEEVVAWAQHPTDGFVESVAVVYGSLSSADEVWITVTRSGSRRLERFDAEHWRRLHAEDVADVNAWHMDASARRFFAEPTASVSGLEHLEGKTVSILVGRSVHPPRKVIEGAIQLEAPAAEVTVGLPFTSTLQPMGLDFPFDDGTAQGRRFQVKGLAARLYRTAGMEWADSPDDKFYPWSNRSASQDGGTAPPLFTGVDRLKTVASYRDAMEVAIKTDGALPLNILYLVPDVEVYGS